MAVEAVLRKPGILDNFINRFRAAKNDKPAEVEVLAEDKREIQGPVKPNNFSDKALNDPFVLMILELRRKGELPDSSKF